MSALLGARDRLNKLSSDWKIAKALLEDEYKAYLDTAFDHVRTPYEFTAHLIDVHRLWCSACRHSGGFQAVATASSNRDVGGLVSFADSGTGSAVVCESQSRQREIKGNQSVASKQSSEQAIDGLQSEAPDLGLNAGLQDINEDSKINIREMSFPLPRSMTSDGVDDFLQVDSNMETTDKPPDKIVVIKQEYHDDESSGENDNDEQRMEEAEDGWISEDSVSNLQSLADWTVVGHSSSEPSTSSLHYDEHSPEDFSQDQCNADWTMIAHSINEPSSSKEYHDERSRKTFSKDLYEGPVDNDARHTSHSETDLQSIVEEKFSSSTKTNITYSLSILQSYCRQKEVEFLLLSERFTSTELNAFLRTFYADVRRGNGQTYAKRSMIALRYGLQCYFLKHRKIDICKGDAFKGSNLMFHAILHKLQKEGKGGVQHRVPITVEDMDKIRKSFDTTSPTDLQNKVFFDLMLHLPRCNRGREALRQMKKDDFAVQGDSDNRLYVHAVRDIVSCTNNQRSEMDDGPNQYGRMYATGKSDCPVKSFCDYISHLNIKCSALWQRAKLRRPRQQSDPWYDNVCMGIHCLGNKMSVISKEAQCSRVYTNHSLRATAVHKLHSAGFQAHHIMSISGYKTEASIKCYPREEDSKRRKMTIASDNVNVDSEPHS